MPALPTQGMGPNVSMDISTKELVAFSRHALDLPFTDKEIQACILKRSTAALRKSPVRRHTRAVTVVVVVAVAVVGTVALPSSVAVGY